MPQSLLRGGKLVTAEETLVADLLITDGKIAAIGPKLEVPDAEVFNIAGRLVMPGGIDPHVHFDLPMFNTVSSDDHYSGTKAAAFGGTTTVIDFVSQDSEDLAACVEALQRRAEKAAIDYSFHMNISRLTEGVLSQLPGLAKAGIPSIKVFTAYNQRLRLQDGEIFRVMRRCAEHGMLVLLHGENGDVIDLLTEEALAAGHSAPIWHARTRPAWGAVEALLRGAALAAQSGASLYIVHMNTAGEVDMLRYARQQGVRVMGETCPQYLFFGEDDLERPDGAKWICSPPMRTPRDNAALWTGLESGVIQVLATDHCPFFFDGTSAIEYEGEKIAIPGKELGALDFTRIPNGLPGVGDRMPVLWTTGVMSGRLTMNEFVALTSTNAARIFGLYPQKGALLPGSDADLVVWDPDQRLTYGLDHSHQRTDYNLYEGWDLHGFPELVFLRGRLIVSGKRWLGRRGMGSFIKRSPGAEVL